MAVIYDDYTNSLINDDVVQIPAVSTKPAFKAHSGFVNQQVISEIMNQLQNAYSAVNDNMYAYSQEIEAAISQNKTKVILRLPNGTPIEYADLDGITSYSAFRTAAGNRKIFHANQLTYL